MLLLLPDRTRWRFFLPFLIALWLLHGCGGDSAPKTLKVGEPAPDFTARDQDGNPVSLAAYKGGPVILRFWSTECRYCRADTPVFNAYYNRYKDAGLRVVYINREADEATVRRFAADLAIPFSVVRDEGGRISALYNIRLEPQTIFISPELKLVGAVLGGVGEPEMRKFLGRFLDISDQES